MNENDIIKDYKNNIALSKIAKKNHLTQETVKKILISNGIEIRKERFRIYPFDYDFFENINTSNKAYYLGLIYADGHLCERSKGVFLNLQIDDINILNSFKKEIKIDKPIQFLKSKKKSRKDMCRLGLIHEKFYNDCINCGLHPRKTFSINMPKIDNNFIRDFIRGYWDGDGSVEIQNNGYSCRLTLTGTKELIESTVSILKKQFQFNYNITQRYPERKNNNYTLVISGVINCFEILTWLYQKNDLCLKRKNDIKNIIVAFVKNRYLIKQGKRFLLKNNKTQEDFLRFTKE